MEFPFNDATIFMQFISIIVSIALFIGLSYGIYKLVEKLRWG